MMYVAYIHPNPSIPVVRSQIYLTEEEQQGLRALARRTGRSQSELIRDAIDALLSRHEQADRTALLRQARGMWRGPADRPDLSTVRRELDRVRMEPGG
jgi:hypothetical protein